MEKKLTIYRIVSVVFIIATLILAVICVRTGQENKKYELERAVQNYIDWYAVQQMAKDVDRIFLNGDQKPDDTLCLYVNRVVYGHALRVEPLIPSFSEFPRYFMTLYDELLSTLCREDLSDELREEGMQLFREFNADLQKVCEAVSDPVEESNQYTEKQRELLDEDSEFYQQVAEETKALSEKYEPALERYFEKVNSSKKSCPKSS